MKKDDLKKFWYLVGKRRLTPEQELEFSDWYHEEKARGRFGGNRDANDKKLEEMLDEFLAD